MIFSVLVVGVGQSSTYLVEYVLKQTTKKSKAWQVTLADSNMDALRNRARSYPKAKLAELDVTDAKQRGELVKDADLVISLMPPHLHILLAKDCLQYKKHLITSSYASPEMRELDGAVRQAGLMFMCEMGLDPGIDHMSASEMFDNTRKVASEIISFQSYCGGLIAPESNNNPWHYKFSWNPVNIINAGKDGARFLKNAQIVQRSYDQMFKNAKTINFEGMGNLAYYPNRDSIPYIQLYGLEDVEHFMRATLRYPQFCKGWASLVDMGLTDMTDHTDTGRLTYRQWLKEKVGYTDSSRSLEDFITEKYKISEASVRKQLAWLELDADTPIGAGLKSSGEILLSVLQNKWAMEPFDKDLVVMQHEMVYKRRGEIHKIISSMRVVGENADFSAMAKTVGLPIYVLTELIADNKVHMPKGVVIPTMPEIYRPVLQRLDKLGISFVESFG